MSHLFICTMVYTVIYIHSICSMNVYYGIIYKTDETLPAEVAAVFWYPLLLLCCSRLLYCFNSSPAKDLRAINNMLKHGGGDSRRAPRVSIIDKRHTTAEVVEGGPAIKHIKF